MTDEEMRDVCFNALKGVGDDSRGAIPDERERLSLVVRRRLSVKEEAMIPGGACDIRRTTEAAMRWAKALRWLRPELHEFAMEEMSS
jgi:hypothetical protein